MAGDGKRIFKTPAAMQEKIEDYFENGGREVIPNSGIKLYSVSGLCLWLGLCERQALFAYSTYDNGAYSDIIKNAKLRIESNISELATIGLIDKTFSIFNLKCNYKWRENTPEEGEEKDQLKELVSSLKDVGNNGK